MYNLHFIGGESETEEDIPVSHFCKPIEKLISIN